MAAFAVIARSASQFLELAQQHFDSSRSRSDGLNKYRLHIFHPTTLDEVLNDILLIMCIESRSGLVAFEEVEYRGVVPIA